MRELTRPIGLENSRRVMNMKSRVGIALLLILALSGSAFAQQPRVLKLAVAPVSVRLPVPARPSVVPVVKLVVPLAMSSVPVPSMLVPLP